MSGFRRMIDMARSPEEVKKDLAPVAMPSPDASAPVYPYGLCINLTEKELDKLGIDVAGCEVSHVIHLNALAEVTSYSEHKNKRADGTEENCCRIELQITHLGLDDEDTEYADEARGERGRRRYGDEPKETEKKPDGGGEMHLRKGRYRDA